MGFCLIAEHRGEAGGVLLHAGVVLHPVLQRISHTPADTRDRLADALDTSDDRLGGQVRFEHVPEDPGLIPGVVHLVAEIIDRVLQASGVLGSVFRVIACPVGLVTELAECIIVGLELFFQLVELGTGVVELDLPVLRSRIVLPERRGRV
ncbi:hypothetical protein, partial [Corynebacterium striatum]